MNLATFVYQRFLGSTGFRKKFWKLARKTLIQIAYDPACRLSIHGRILQLPLSHALPEYLKAHPHYDRLPGRISDFIRQRQGAVRCIDVGANVGDSVAAFYNSDQDLFLAIEPNPNFHKYLLANWSWNHNVTPISTICASERSSGTFTIQEKSGTASVVKTAGGATMTARPLGEIVNDYPPFKQANILKIDTDGHDFEVIAGAKKLISSKQPAVLFECDAFGNDQYVEDCLGGLNFFLSSGYHFFLLYDNFGHLMGKYPLSDLSAIRNMLFFQLTSPFYYFDILVMKDADIAGFYKSEVDFFVEQMPDKSLQQAARSAAEL